MAHDTTKHEDRPEPEAAGGQADKHRPENDQKALDKRLDDGLEETFPSSDPVSVKITT